MARDLGRILGNAEGAGLLVRWRKGLAGAGTGIVFGEDRVGSHGGRQGANSRLYEQGFTGMPWPSLMVGLILTVGGLFRLSKAAI